MQHEGDLGFRDGEARYEELKRLAARLPTVATVYLDRPAILTGVRGRARGIVANFGASDEALLDVVAGRARPTGRLPFELPSSMDAVRAQKADLPHDSPNPLYPIGAGLRYPASR